MTEGDAGHGDIAIDLADPGTLQADCLGEGYHLDVTTAMVTLKATTLHGLFNGVQSIRQLLPGWIASPAIQPGDQGFRIVINGFPNLTEIGAQGAVGTDGRTMDAGGFWTQAQFSEVVAYAAARFITVVPEVDTPGHTNAIIMSEYNDTANPLLSGAPDDINCSTKNPPEWSYTGKVGYSALCPDSDNTYAILGAIIKQLAALSSSQYYNIGGDEVPTTVLSQEQYASLVNREAGIVADQGKTVMGWAEIAGAGTDVPAGSVAEYSHSPPITATATASSRGRSPPSRRQVCRPARSRRPSTGATGPPPPARSAVPRQRAPR